MDPSPEPTLEQQLQAHLSDPNVPDEEKQRAAAAFTVWKQSQAAAPALQGAPPNLEQAITSVPGKMAEFAPLAAQAGVKGIETASELAGVEQAGQDIQQRGLPNFLAREALIGGATAGLGSNPVARRILGEAAFETSAAVNRAYRYLFTPIAAGGIQAGVEAGSRYLAGIPQKDLTGISMDLLSGALAQVPASYIQGRSLRNEEIGNLDAELNKLVEREAATRRGEVLGREAPEVRAAAAQEAAGKNVVEINRPKLVPGVGVVSGGEVQPSLQQLKDNVMKQVGASEVRMEAEKNTRYNNVVKTATKQRATAVGAGPSIAADARQAYIDLKRSASAPQALLQGPMQNIDSVEGLLESLNAIQREAAGLTDVPYATLDRWREALQSHAPTLWQRSRPTETYQRGVIEGFYGRLKGTMAGTIEGTPAAQQLRDANDFFAHNIPQIRQLKNDVLSDKFGGAYVQSLRELAAKGGPEGERISFLLDKAVNPETARHLRSQFQEEWFAQHLMDDNSGMIDWNKVRKSLDDMRARPSTGGRDMQIIFGQKGAQIRDGVDGVQQAMDFLHWNQGPVNVKAARDEIYKQLEAAGLRRDGLMKVNEQQVQRLFTAGKGASRVAVGAAAVPAFYHVTTALSNGDWKTAIGLAAQGAVGGLGTVFLANMFSDKNALKTFNRMTKLADTAANHQQLVRLGSAMVAHFFQTQFGRAERAAMQGRVGISVGNIGEEIPGVTTEEPAAAEAP